MDGTVDVGQWFSYILKCKMLVMNMAEARAHFAMLLNMENESVSAVLEMLQLLRPYMSSMLRPVRVSW